MILLVADNCAPRGDWFRSGTELANRMVPVLITNECFGDTHLLKHELLYNLGLYNLVTKSVGTR